MQAGRELDALVAEKVMGWKLGDNRGAPAWFAHDEFRCEVWQFKPSEDIAAAWEVVEKLGKTWWFDVELTGNLWHAQFESQEHISERQFADDYSTDSAPHAICKAALMAMGHSA